MKYFIIDNEKRDDDYAPFIFLPKIMVVKKGHIFQINNGQKSMPVMYKVIEVKRIDKRTAECFCEKIS